MKGRSWAFVLTALSLAGSAFAQSETRRPAAEAGGEQRLSGTNDGVGRREEAFRIVDAYVISHLQDSLGLSDEQYSRLVPLVTRLQTDRREYFLSRARLLREMRRLLRAGGASEGQVIGKCEELKRLEADGPPRVARDMGAVDGALAPLQQAKYRLLELEVEQRMRELIGRARAGASDGSRR